MNSNDEANKSWLLALRDDELAALHASLYKAAEYKVGMPSDKSREWEDSLLSSPNDHLQFETSPVHEMKTTKSDFRYLSPSMLASNVGHSNSSSQVPDSGKKKVSSSVIYTSRAKVQYDDDEQPNSDHSKTIMTFGGASQVARTNGAQRSYDSTSQGVKAAQTTAQNVAQPSPLYRTAREPEAARTLSPTPTLDSPSGAYTAQSPLRSYPSPLPWSVDAVGDGKDPGPAAERRARRRPSTAEAVEGLAQIRRAQLALAGLRERLAGDGLAAAPPVAARLADCLLWQEEAGRLLDAMRRSGDLSLQARNEELERQVQAAIAVQQVPRRPRPLRKAGDAT